MAPLVKNLAYEDSSNGFKWFGTKTELKRFVNFALAVEKDRQYGEWTENKSHSAFTFKQQGCFSRFYTTTKKLVIQGPDHARLRDKLFDLLKTASEESSSNQSTQPDSTPPCDSDLSIKELRIDLSTLKKEVEEIKKKMLKTRNEDTEAVTEQIQELVQENKRLCKFRGTK